MTQYLEHHIMRLLKLRRECRVVEVDPTNEEESEGLNDLVIEGWKPKLQTSTSVFDDKGVIYTFTQITLTRIVVAA